MCFWYLNAKVDLTNSIQWGKVNKQKVINWFTGILNWCRQTFPILITMHTVDKMDKYIMILKWKIWIQHTFNIYILSSDPVWVSAISANSFSGFFYTNICNTSPRNNQNTQYVKLKWEIKIVKNMICFEGSNAVLKVLSLYTIYNKCLTQLLSPTSTLAEIFWRRCL